jgi:hypothetical protein
LKSLCKTSRCVIFGVNFQKLFLDYFFAKKLSFLKKVPPKMIIDQE